MPRNFMPNIFDSAIQQILRVSVAERNRRKKVSFVVRELHFIPFPHSDKENIRALLLRHERERVWVRASELDGQAGGYTITIAIHPYTDTHTHATNTQQQCNDARRD